MDDGAFRLLLIDPRRANTSYNASLTGMTLVCDRGSDDTLKYQFPGYDQQEFSQTTTAGGAVALDFSGAVEPQRSSVVTVTGALTYASVTLPSELDYQLRIVTGGNTVSFGTAVKWTDFIPSIVSGEWIVRFMRRNGIIYARASEVQP